MSKEKELATKPVISPVSGLKTEDVREFADAFAADAVGKVVQNAVVTTTVDSVALNRQRVVSIEPVTEIKLDQLGATNQKHSGRCWIFAALNVLRLPVAKELGVESLEFSQTYLHFYDKLEKANKFLAAMEQLKDADDDDRLLTYLLDSPIGDGGHWEMVVNLIKKYGLVPATVFPDSESSLNTKCMNRVLTEILRRAAWRIRMEAGSVAEIAEVKKQTLADVYRVLCIHLGTPPSEFCFQYRDKDKKFHREGTFTPLEFAEKYLPANLDKWILLVHDPRPAHPVHRRYQLEHSSNLAESPAITYTTVTMEEMKAACLAMLKAEKAVWYGCDVSKQFYREKGYWASDMFNYEQTYSVNLHLDKAQMLTMRALAPTHAMTLVGVDFAADSGAPRTWRVENSWGDDRADKGYYTMDDSWFEPYVLEVAVDPEILSDELKAELEAAKDAETIVLPAWDIMF